MHIFDDEGVNTMPKEAIKEKTKFELKVPKRYKVLIYNDDYTTMEFVTGILMTVFEKTKEEAVKLMLEVHKGTYAVVGVYVRDIARTKVNRATSLARNAGYPLKLEAVEE